MYLAHREAAGIVAVSQWSKKSTEWWAAEDTEAVAEAPFRALSRQMRTWPLPDGAETN